MDLRSIIFTFKKDHSAAVLLLVFAVIVCFANTLQNSFIWDDVDVIIKNEFVKSLRYVPFLLTPEYWRTYHPGLKGQYRPIRILTIALDYSIWKLNPMGYHLTNLIFHLCNVVLIYLFIGYLVGPAETREVALDNRAFISALLFAVHPIHTESVTYIKNRSDLLTSIFVIISLVLFIRFASKPERRSRFLPYLCSFIFFILALVTKEMAYSLPLLLVAYILCFLPRKEWRKRLIATLPFFLALLGVVASKLAALGTVLEVEESSKVTFSVHMSIIIKTIGYYLKLLVLPFSLNAERLFVVPLSFTEPAVFMSGAVVAVSVAIMCISFARYSKHLAFGIAWIFLTIAPVSNIFFLSARPIAEQRLYIPSVGFCFIVAMIVKESYTSKLVWRGKGIFKRFIPIFLGGLLVAYSSTTINRNFDWRDPVTFWEKTTQSAPYSFRAYNNLADAYVDVRRYNDAIEAYKKSIRLAPSMASTYVNLGLAYAARKDFEKAINEYRKALAIDPRHGGAYNNLAVVYYYMGDHNRAVEYCDKAIEVGYDVHPKLLKMLEPYR